MNKPKTIEVISLHKLKVFAVYHRDKMIYEGKVTPDNLLEASKLIDAKAREELDNIVKETEEALNVLTSLKGETNE